MALVELRRNAVQFVVELVGAGVAAKIHGNKTMVVAFVGTGVGAAVLGGLVYGAPRTKHAPGSCRWHVRHSGVYNLVSSWSSSISQNTALQTLTSA